MDLLIFCVFGEFLSIYGIWLGITHCIPWMVGVDIAMMAVLGWIVEDLCINQYYD